MTSKKGKKLRPRPPAIYDLNYPIFSGQPRTPKQKNTTIYNRTYSGIFENVFPFFKAKLVCVPKLATSNMAFFQTTLAHPSQKLFLGFLASHLKIHGQRQLCLGFLSGQAYYSSAPPACPCSCLAGGSETPRHQSLHDARLGMSWPASHCKPPASATCQSTSL